MNAIPHTRSRNLGALVAVLLAAGLVGLLALLLMSGSATNSESLTNNEPGLPQNARYPQGNDKFAPGRILATPEAETAVAYAALCHGEGLLDPANQALLVDADESVAHYCTPRALPAGGADAAEGYPEICRHGGGPLPPMDPAPYNDGPGSIAEFCTADPQPDSGQKTFELDPQGEGLMH
jgi:hypothetical protein